jgi:hypothetical protein
MVRNSIIYNFWRPTRLSVSLGNVLVTLHFHDEPAHDGNGASLYTIDLKHFKPLKAHGLKLFE